MMRRKSREVAFCGVLAALASAILLLGSVIPAATYCCPILAMIVLLPVLEEFGTRMAWTAYAAVSILALLLVADKETAAVYVFFGGYPMIQPLLNRIRLRGVRLTAKLAFCNLTVFALYALLLNLFALNAVVQEFQGMSRAFFIVLLLLGNFLFLAMDLALARMRLLWNKKLRKIFFPRG